MCIFIILIALCNTNIQENTPGDETWFFWQLCAYLSGKSTPTSTSKMKTELGEAIDLIKNMWVPLSTYLFTYLLSLLIFKSGVSLYSLCWLWICGDSLPFFSQVPVPSHTLVTVLALNLKPLPQGQMWTTL